MPVELTVRVKPEGLKELDKLSKEQTRVAAAGFVKSTTILLGEVRRSINTDWLSRSANSRRTGNLARSFFAFIDINKAGTFQGGVGSNAVYAAIHEDGGEIRATKSQFLTIPLDPNSIPLGATARDIPDLFVIRKKNGTLFLARQEGKRLRFVYVLKKEVRIRPKRYLKRAIDRALPMIEEMLGNDLETGIQRT